MRDPRNPDRPSTKTSLAGAEASPFSHDVDRLDGDSVPAAWTAVEDPPSSVPADPFFSERELTAAGTGVGLTVREIRTQGVGSGGGPAESDVDARLFESIASSQQFSKSSSLLNKNRPQCCLRDRQKSLDTALCAEQIPLLINNTVAAAWF